MSTTQPLRCQVEAARFATRRDGIDEIRTRTIRAAIAHMVAGQPAKALNVMLDGLARQAPLTFHRPQTQGAPE